MQNKSKTKTAHTRNILTVSFIALAVAFITWGIVSNALNEVYMKASLICYDCIGLG